MRLLLIEDETALLDLIQRSLARAGFTVDTAGAAEGARDALAASRYDAIVLDLGLPDEDGLVILKDLRTKRDTTPVLILTARDGVNDRVAGLNSGADDYLLKPFAVDELIARLKALLRRPNGALGVVLEAGNISFDTVGRTVAIGDQTLPLTAREMALLENLLRRVGRVVPKRHLEERIYGFDDEVTPNSLEVLLHRLRRKLAGSGFSGEIHTVRGVGYLLSETPA
ncbi:response regulator transcription factor [Ferrovibrio terrae]|uniref:Response regulator transcription factor n=1 Tax=Ferrovibrio terrae TaxID=2594003 RepID=A0A516GWR0_9PROT|nr:response regulator transcription factor [Ferrovibrio terrae]QDO95978.1 response regulator transcription factor [Ferrovibrio terrae]